ncbi:MAG TPA: UxaA family hydrolase [Nocardioidaceae bacterium]|nr:UxaA family hydrolase [Nocardioidaceae bacterium]
MTENFARVAVLPEPGDNVAIVTRDLEPGTRLRRGDVEIVVAHRVLEGHRIVVDPTRDGEALLSWSTPFARAHGDLAPGDYVCTPTSLAALRARGIADLPPAHTAVNEPLTPYRLDESALPLGAQVAPVARPGTFLGYARPHGPAGTRNFVVIIGVTSRSAAFVTGLADRLSRTPHPGVDGVVPVAHTEAGEEERPNNAGFVLSVLAGFVVHPNVGAVLLVDTPGDAISAQDVQAFLQRSGRPAIAVPHAVFSRTGAFEADLVAAARIVEPWLPAVAQERTEQPLSDLRIALQCGGSDAFSGITANPLAGGVAAEVIRHGGAAVLAETDELIGAEAYVLENVASVEVARRFVGCVESFKERVGWHGHTAEGNPSGGNVYRGLYNIVLKSVGAARKRDRRLRLDHVVDYGEPLPGPGFTFMDSPGNDLESVAGEVASGCTMVFFTTGNGSITNFPFVPTLKFVTTSARYELLRNEMDVDAGRYLTGTPMPELIAETFDQTVRTASGELSAGERAGHSQVSIWRNWKQTRPVPVRLGFSADDRDEDLSGLPLSTPVRRTPPSGATTTFPMYDVRGRRSPERLALVLPTSLCSGQIAVRIADRLAATDLSHSGVTRAVALPHTEGCGVSSGAAENTYARMMTGYLAHPSVGAAVLLEHGCEKTHNDYFRSRLEAEGVDPTVFGWASIQRDGGIDAATARVLAWFEEAAAGRADLRREQSDLGDLTIALDARGPLPAETAVAFAELGCWVVGAGGSVLLPSGGALLSDERFRMHAFGSADEVPATLAHGQRPREAGWHVMRMPGSDWTEAGSGLGAGGAQLLLTHVTGGSVSGQRLLPVLQVTADPVTADRCGSDLDAVLTGDFGEQTLILLDTLAATASGARTARAMQTGNVAFQVTRGRLGTSM